MLIIGITGTLGAGKGTIVEYLVQNKGFSHFSVREFLIDEIKQQGLPVNRDSMVVVANGLRKEHSPSYIVDQLFDRAKESGTNSIIESIRTPGEVESLRKRGKFILIAVDADPRQRYQRIRSRGSVTDQVSYEDFVMNEDREMSSDDPNQQNIGKVILMADFTLVNNGTVGELFEQVEEVLNNIND